MEYSKNIYGNIKTHFIKTDKFKTSKIDVVFQKKVDKDLISRYTFLADVLSESSLKYPTNQKLAIHLEDLYNPRYECFASRMGNILNFTFSLEFINPKFINEEDYLENIIDFLFEIIERPNASKNAFEKRVFDLIKTYREVDIKSLTENPMQIAIDKSLNAMDKDSISAKRSLGTLEELNSFTKENIYEAYLDLMHNSNIQIFIGGNLNKEDVLDIISKYALHLNSNDLKVNYLVNNKEKSDICIEESKSNFIQSQLIMLYNLSNLSDMQRELVVPIMNYILGSGGLSSKLYQYLREQNGFCYRVSSVYYKFDQLYIITSSMDKDNAIKAKKMINKAILEMQNGDFSDEEINDAKQNLLLSLKYGLNDLNGIMINYEFSELFNFYSIEKKIEDLDKVTKEDICKVAKMIKANTEYLLVGEEICKK